jgi:SAM-dependent methyltransferase
MPMPTRHRLQPWMRAWGAGLLLTCVIAAQALGAGVTREECEKSYKPSTGQAGKDVVWVPTNDPLVTRMLEMAQVGKNDLVYDLGAGDGKIAIAAAKQFGARAVGVEYNPDMAQLAQCMVKAEGVGDRVKVVQGDIFETDFSAATVVTLYLLPELNLRLRPTILKMKPGTRVVSHSFLMDDWRPDESSVSTDGAAYLWIVPAEVAGQWTFKQQNGKDSFDVSLTQTFQKLDGTVGKGTDDITNAEMNGNQIEMMFSEGDVQTRLKGVLQGDRIEAQVTRNDVTSTFIGTRR